jgi:hypothetical protein
MKRMGRRATNFEGLSTCGRQARWAGKVAFSYQLSRRAVRNDCLRLARVIMRRARANIETIVTRLRASGYRFVDPKLARRRPPKSLAKQIDRFEALGFHVPISLRVFWEEVGSVNLMGTHPDWPCTGYDLFERGRELWTTDPLVIEYFDPVKQYKSWKWNRDEFGDDYLDCIGPFRLEVAPDELHKAALSGGGPYSMACDVPTVDAVLLEQRHCACLVPYLKIAFDWGGFPGFECYPDAPLEFINNLKRDLLPL